jgi:methyl-accepting chemotaxis protein
MTVPKKMLVGYAGLLVLVIALAGVGAGLVVWLSSWQTDYSDTVAQFDNANEIVVGEACMLDYILLPLMDQRTENRSTYESKLKLYTALANDALASATKLETDPEDSKALQDLGAQFARYEEAIADTLVLEATDPAGASAKATDELLPLAQQVQTAADLYKQNQKSEEISLRGSLRGTSNTILIVMLALAGLAFVAGATVGVLLSRSIARQLRAAIGGINTSAAGLLSVASQVSASAAQTAASTNETTATVEEVKQTAQLAHEKAAEVAESSQNLAQVAEAGRATVEETIAGFDRTQEQMSVVAETIDRLGEQAQAVGEIIATVNDLAEQSNLLSVNASIEAAKAGDQGKGFTVVAQEVRSLAEQSKQAVAQVRTILSEIRRARDVAVRAAEQGQETVAAGREQSRESGESVQAMTETAAKAAQAAVQISASSRQQLAGMEQISQAIESINQAGSQSLEGTRQVEEEVRHLQELALNLKRLVESKAKAHAKAHADAAKTPLAPAVAPIRGRAYDEPRNEEDSAVGVAASEFDCAHDEDDHGDEGRDI